MQCTRWRWRRWWRLWVWVDDIQEAFNWCDGGRWCGTVVDRWIWFAGLHQKCVLFLLGKSLRGFFEFVNVVLNVAVNFLFFFHRSNFIYAMASYISFLSFLFCIVFYLSNLNIIYFGSCYPHNLQVILKRWWNHSKANGALEPYIIRNRFFFGIPRIKPTKCERIP